MITNIKVPLEKDEYRALEEAADEDIRSTSGQARYLLRKVLTESGHIDKVKQEEQDWQKEQETL